MAVCAKMQPIVQEQLDLQKRVGKSSRRCPDCGVLLRLWAAGGVLLCAEIPGEERVRRTKAFLLEMLHLKMSLFHQTHVVVEPLDSVAFKNAL